MAKKRSPAKKAKDEAWKECSLYIRHKYAKGGICTCYTCGVKKPIKEMQAGHGISGRNNAILLLEEVIRPQCLTEESSLRLFDGTSKSIKHIKVGNKLWAFDKDTFEKKVSIVENKESFIPDELYEVQLEDGNKFYATLDHKLVANKKWVTIKKLLHNITSYDILEL